MFFINVPIGIAAALTALLYLRELRNQEATVKLDVTGAVLVTGALASLIYGVVNTTTQGWTSSTTLEWLIGGAGAMVAFLWWESRVASHPLVPFRIFRSRSLTTANLMMFLVGAAFFAMWYFLTFYFQFILGYGPVKAGFAFLPMALGIIAGAQLSSRLLARTGARTLLLVGGRPGIGGLLVDLAHSDPQFLRGRDRGAVGHLRVRDGSAVHAPGHHRHVGGRSSRRGTGVGRP